MKGISLGEWVERRDGRFSRAVTLYCEAAELRNQLRRRAVSVPFASPAWERLSALEIRARLRAERRERAMLHVWRER